MFDFSVLSAVAADCLHLVHQALQLLQIMLLNRLPGLMPQTFLLQKWIGYLILQKLPLQRTPSSVILHLTVHFLNMAFRLVCHGTFHDNLFSMVLFDGSRDGKMPVSVRIQFGIQHFFLKSKRHSAHLDQEGIGKAIHDPLRLQRIRHLFLPKQRQTIFRKIPGRKAVFLHLQRLIRKNLPRKFVIGIGIIKAIVIQAAAFHQPLPFPFGKGLNRMVSLIITDPVKVAICVILRCPRKILQPQPVLDGNQYHAVRLQQTSDVPQKRLTGMIPFRKAHGVFKHAIQDDIVKLFPENHVIEVSHPDFQILKPFMPGIIDIRTPLGQLHSHHSGQPAAQKSADGTASGTNLQTRGIRLKRIPV